MSQTCAWQILVKEGYGVPTFYDPSNVLGGAEYERCSKDVFNYGKWGPLCYEHYLEAQEVLKKLEAK